MEKSIEDIWKNSFQEKGALEAPKIENLYNRKSIHIIEKFKRMFKINLIAIVVFSLLFLVVSYFIGILVMGVIYACALTILVIINKKLLSTLETIDQSMSSYDYLKAFTKWIKMQVKVNELVSRVLYPVIFLSIVLGLWFKDAEGLPLGERFVNKLLISFPNMYMVYGFPLIGIIGVIFLMLVLAMLGGRIYRWDLNIVYGKIFKKLEELNKDFEELNHPELKETKPGS